MGQTLLAVPRESDIPPALSTLARWRVVDRTRRADARAGGGVSERKKPSRAGSATCWRGVLRDSGIAERVEQAP